jgi:hypothetical protein
MAGSARLPATLSVHLKGSADTKPFDYDQYRNGFRNLGRECGLEKYPELYDLRRVGGKLITGEHAASSHNASECVLIAYLTDTYF